MTDNFSSAFMFIFIIILNIFFFLPPKNLEMFEVMKLLFLMGHQKSFVIENIVQSKYLHRKHSARTFGQEKAGKKKNCLSTRKVFLQVNAALCIPQRVMCI